MLLLTSIIIALSINYQSTATTIPTIFLLFNYSTTITTCATTFLLLHHASVELSLSSMYVNSMGREESSELLEGYRSTVRIRCSSSLYNFMSSIIESLKQLLSFFALLLL